MIVDLDATFEKVRSETKRLEDENDEQFNARTYHMALLVVEHGTPIYLPDQEKELNDNE